MSTDLHRAFDALARDVPALADVDAAIEGHRARRRRQSLAAGALAAAALVAVALAGPAGVRQGAPAPPAHDQQNRDLAARSGPVLPRVLDLSEQTILSPRIEVAPLRDGAANRDPAGQQRHRRSQRARIAHGGDRTGRREAGVESRRAVPVLEQHRL